jgi:transposase
MLTPEQNTFADEPKATKGLSRADFDLQGSEYRWASVSQMHKPRQERAAAKGSPLKIAPADRRRLESWVRAGTTPQRVVKRARIVLLAGEGASSRAIARRLHISPHTAMLWRRRYQSEGTVTLWHDAPGRGRRPTIDPKKAARARELLGTRPAEGGRWSIRRLATATGLSRASVHRIVVAAAAAANCETDKATIERASRGTRVARCAVDPATDSRTRSPRDQEAVRGYR